MSKLSQEGIVVRYLFERKGEWIAGHELAERASSVIGKNYLIQDADTRAHKLARQGSFSSPNFKYYIEHRSPRRNGNPTRFAQFRVTSRVLHLYTNGLRNYTVVPMV